VTITVNNTAPTASAGSAQTKTVGQTVTLDATGSSDPDGQSLTYSWTQTGGSPSVTLSSSTAAQPTYTAPAGPSSQTFQVTVSDGQGGSNTASVTITVNNSAPTANAGTDQSVASSASVTLDATGSSDPDGQTLSYTWSQTSGATVSLSDTHSAQPTFTAPVGPATLIFQVTVSDGQGGSNSASVTIHVAALVNTAPTADAGPTQTVHVGQTVTLDGTGSTDPDSDPLTYSWVQTGGAGTVSLTGATTANPTFASPGGPDTLQFTLTVDDGHGHQSSDAVTINVANTSPVASAGANQQVAVSANVTLLGGGFDPDGPAVTYSWSQTSGTPVSLSDSTVAQPTFTMPATPDTLGFTLTVTDNQGATATASVTVSSVVQDLDTAIALPSGINMAKTSATVQLQVGNQGNQTVTADPANFTVSATVNGNPVSYPFTPVSTATKTLAPNPATDGACSTSSPDAPTNCKFNFTWTYGTALHAGDVIVFSTCYHQAGDSNPGNDCSTLTYGSGPGQTIDASTSVTIANVSTAQGSALRFVVSVTNNGTLPIALDPSDVLTSLTVNGVPNNTGTTNVNSPLTRTNLAPGITGKWTFTWQSQIALHAGDVQTVTAAVHIPGDVNPGNDTSTATLVRVK
jgi:hypothetical protein